MKLVDADRFFDVMALGTAVHPGLVLPLVLVDVPNDRGVLGAHVRRKAYRIRFGNHIALIVGLDLIFIDFAFAQGGNE